MLSRLLTAYNLEILNKNMCAYYVLLFFQVRKKSEIKQEKNVDIAKLIEEICLKIQDIHFTVKIQKKKKNK